MASSLRAIGSPQSRQDPGGLRYGSLSKADQRPGPVLFIPILSNYLEKLDFRISQQINYGFAGGLQTDLSPLLLSNLIWQICSEIRPIMKMIMEVVKRSALILVNRPAVVNV